MSLDFMLPIVQNDFAVDLLARNDDAALFGAVREDVWHFVLCKVESEGNMNHTAIDQLHVPRYVMAQAVDSLLSSEDRPRSITDSAISTDLWSSRSLWMRAENRFDLDMLLTNEGLPESFGIALQQDIPLLSRARDKVQQHEGMFVLPDAGTFEGASVSSASRNLIEAVAFEKELHGELSGDPRFGIYAVFCVMRDYCSAGFWPSTADLDDFQLGRRAETIPPDVLKIYMDVQQTLLTEPIWGVEVPEIPKQAGEIVSAGIAKLSIAQRAQFLLLGGMHQANSFLSLAPILNVISFEKYVELATDGLQPDSKEEQAIRTETAFIELLGKLELRTTDRSTGGSLAKDAGLDMDDDPDYPRLVKAATKGDRESIDSIFKIGELRLEANDHQNAALAFKEAAICFRIQAFRTKAFAEDKENSERTLEKESEILRRWIKSNPNGLQKLPRTSSNVIDGEGLNALVLQVLQQDYFSDVAHYLYRKMSDLGVQFYSPGGSLERRIIGLISSAFGLSKGGLSDRNLHDLTVRIGIDQIADEVERLAIGTKIDIVPDMLRESARQFRKQQSSIFPDATPAPAVLDEIDKAVIHIHNLREQQKAVVRTFRDLQQSFNATEGGALQELERAMRAADLEQYQNECLYAEIRRKTYPQIVDTDKLLAWTQQPDRRALVNVTESRGEVRLKVNELLWRRLLRAGEEVPGMESVTEEMLVVGHLE